MKISKKMKLAIGILCVFMAIHLFYSESVNAASGSAYVAFNTDLGIGNSPSINTILDNMGYSVNYQMNPSVSDMRTYLSSPQKVAYIHTHGNAGYITANGGSCLYADTITSGPSKLVYLSACYSANTGSRGNLRTKFQNLGTDASVTFSSTISAYTENDGINLIDKLAFIYMSNGYSVGDAFVTARATVYSSASSFYGSDSVVITGYSQTIN